MQVDKIRGGLVKSSLLTPNNWTFAHTNKVKVVHVNSVVSPKHQWKQYEKKVRALTELVSYQIPGIIKRGWRDHHIDHIISVWDGFRLGLEPYKIADISNLRMLPYNENMAKGRY